MSNPQTFYTVGGEDLSGIFQPLGSLTQALSTGYKIPDGRDLNQIFASISSGSQIGYDTGFRVNNENYIYSDLRLIFAAKINTTITPTGTFSSATNSGYTIVSFTANNGTFNISSSDSNTFYYLVVGGGGAGGSDAGGGGGAGGVVQGTFSITGSKTINIVVGAGGIVTYSTSTKNGDNSSLSYDSTTITGTGGGYGGWASGWGTPKNQAANGGCGGGCGTNTTTPGTGSQGKNGGTSGAFIMGGGGGGMNTNGGNGGSNTGGNGGNGILCTQNGINLIYPSTYWGGGGGGGAGGSSVAGNGGLGGGGGGASSSSGGVSPGTQGIGGSGLNSGKNGTATRGGNGGANTGGGGGGGPQLNSGGNGGSGIVVIAYLTPV